MELDRQSIERRDFPIVRRGYDPGIVNAHLAALADQVERGDGASRKSVAAIASGMVQSILEAAESTATDIERSAKDGADQLRNAAEQAAQSLRSDAIAKSRGHVSAVAGATEPMLERLSAMERELNALVGNFRSGAQHLTSELDVLVQNMYQLYGAATAAADARHVGSGEAGAGELPSGYQPLEPVETVDGVPVPPHDTDEERMSTEDEPPTTAYTPPPAYTPPSTFDEPASTEDEPPTAAYTPPPAYTPPSTFDEPARTDDEPPSPGYTPPSATAYVPPGAPGYTPPSSDGEPADTDEESSDSDDDPPSPGYGTPGSSYP